MLNSHVSVIILLVTIISYFKIRKKKYFKAIEIRNLNTTDDIQNRTERACVYVHCLNADPYSDNLPKISGSELLKILFNN